jgi:hypothetical protein
VFESVNAELRAIEATEILPEAGDLPAGLSGSVDTEAGAPEATARENREDRDRPGRRRRKRRRRGRRPDDSTVRATTETGEDELELPEAPEEAFEDAEGLVSSQEAGDLSESPAGEREEEGAERPRRRRRRRKRRTPAREEQAAESSQDPREQAADAEDALAEPDELLEPDELVEQDELVERGERGEQEEPGSETEDESAGDLSDLDDDVERASHHGIPTWQESVGIVIAANMESRAKNPGGSSRNRGGRGRGGRS